MKKTLLSFAFSVLASAALNAQNPYLPLWEYIPDGEPYVFEDPDCPGQYRVYGYWGFESCNMAELDPETMASVKPGAKVISNFLTSSKEDGQDKYVFIYSRKTLEGEFGLPSCNYSLTYAYGDSPLGPFTYGGTIIEGRAREVVDGTVTVMVEGPEKKRGGVKIGEFRLAADAAQEITAYTIPVDAIRSFKGKQPLFFVFESDIKKESLCEIYDFQFVRR